MLYVSFIQINPSVPSIISAEDFLEGMHCMLHGKPHSYTPLKPNITDHLITANFRTSIKSEKVETVMIYDPGTILMENDDFAPSLWEECEYDKILMHKAETSSHHVGIYKWGDKKLCLKLWPEAPAIEFVAHHLYRAIFPSQEHPPLPASATILLNGQMILVLQFMEGESLHSIAKKIEKIPALSRQYKLNLSQYQRIAIYCYLALPEDCRPHNCILTITESGEYKIILIDNERSFGHVSSSGYSHATLGRIHTRTHCVVFCFHKLLSMPLAQDVFEELVSSRSTEYITAFSHKLRIALAYRTTLNTKVPEKHKEKATMHNPGIEAITGVFARLQVLKDIAISKRTDGLAQIFTRVLSPLADMYGFNVPLSPDELKLDDQLLPALRLVRRIDARRFSGPTPTSAYVPLDVYFDQPDLHSLSGSRSVLSSPVISPTSSTGDECTRYSRLPWSCVGPLIQPLTKRIQTSGSKLLDAAELSAVGLVA